MPEIYKSFIMEVRPRLQSCNVYITFKGKTNSKILVNLKENAITVSADNKIDIINMPNQKILINTLSGLQATDSYLIFRFQTQNNSKFSGNFQAELLEYKSKESSHNLNQILPTRDVPYILQCGTCFNNLTNAITFKKILPLPSAGIDMSDWFCHKLDNDNIVDLNPKLEDFLYSNYYFHLNKTHISNIKLVSNKLIVCKRCLGWLGLYYKSETIQFWSNTVAMETENSKIISNALVDFISIIKSSLNESLFRPNKILFECFSTPNNTEYLSLWVLEKNLELYVKDCKIPNCNMNSNNGMYKVVKAIFKFSKEYTQQVKEWLNDSNVTQIKISKPMMINGLNHLYEMCKMIPECYRKSNDFYVSYLIL